MKTGLLWFDNDPKTDLPTKVSRAAAYYTNKYGQKPNLCFVHPSAINQLSSPRPDIDIKPHQRVKPHHLWLGIHEIN